MATRFTVSLAHTGCDHAGSVVWEDRDRADALGESGPVVVILARGFFSASGANGSIEILCAGCGQTVAAAARSDQPGVAGPKDEVLAEPATDPADADADKPEPMVPHEAAAATSDDPIGDPIGDPIREIATEPEVATETAGTEPAKTPGPELPGVPDAEAGPSGSLTAAAEVQAAAPAAAVAAHGAAGEAAIDLPHARADAAAAPAGGPDPTAPAGRDGHDTPPVADDAAADAKVQADIEALFSAAYDVAPIPGDAIPNHLADRLPQLANRLRQRRE